MPNKMAPHVDMMVRQFMLMRHVMDHNMVRFMVMRHVEKTANLVCNPQMVAHAYKLQTQTRNLHFRAIKQQTLLLKLHVCTPKTPQHTSKVASVRELENYTVPQVMRFTVRHVVLHMVLPMVMLNSVAPPMAIQQAVDHDTVVPPVMPNMVVPQEHMMVRQFMVMFNMVVPQVHMTVHLWVVVEMKPWVAQMGLHMNVNIRVVRQPDVQMVNLFVMVHP
jgi:hypothetical protein